MSVQKMTKQEMTAALVKVFLNNWPDVRVQLNGWLDRGDGIAVYENKDLGHSDLGHQQFVSFGSEAAQLVGDEPPSRLPDIGSTLNFRYYLVATYRGEPL